MVGYKLNLLDGTLIALSDNGNGMSKGPVAFEVAVTAS